MSDSDKLRKQVETMFAKNTVLINENEQLNNQLAEIRKANEIKYNDYEKRMSDNATIICNLHNQIADLKQSLDFANQREKENLEQIEKMKCCGNCKHINNENCICDDCKRLEIPNHNTNDEWELEK